MSELIQRHERLLGAPDSAAVVTGRLAVADAFLPVPSGGETELSSWYDALTRDVAALGGYADQMYPLLPSTGDDGRDREHAAEREQTIRRELPDMLRRELSFFDKLCTLGEELVAAKGRGVLLCDVDHTISDMNEDATRIVRPAFRWAIRKLRAEYGNRIRVGLLTTINAGFDYERCFEGIDRNAIADEFIIDVRYYARQSRLGMDEDHARRSLTDVPIECLGPLLHPRIRTAIQDGHVDPLLPQSEGKLWIANEVSTGNPHEAFGIVDNYLFPALLHPESTSLMGVSVGEEIQGSLGGQLYERQLRTFEKQLAEAQLPLSEFGLLPFKPKR